MEYDLQQFERDFMYRTRSNLARYNGEHESTMLLNCMVGLLIVPRERLLRLLPDEPSWDPEDWGIQRQAIVCVERGQGRELADRSIRWFVIKLRNAVAHFHVLPVHKEGRVRGFEFWDRSGFRAILSLPSLRQFVERLLQWLEDQWSRSAIVEVSDGAAGWTKGARLFTRAPAERVYIIDCPSGLQRQCYEIASSSAEYYIAGSDENMPVDGATDIIVECNSDQRRARIVALAVALARELPEQKRLSVYTNDEELIRILRCDVEKNASARLAYFGVFASRTSGFGVVRNRLWRDRAEPLNGLGSQ
jgi:hypothetical protein